MNNTVLKIAAGLLVLGAIIVAVLGIRLSQQPAPQPQVQVVQVPASAPAQQVVVAAVSLKQGQPITPQDLAIRPLQSPPELSYREQKELIGKTPVTDIPAGTPLVPSLFLSDSMASLLRSGERALALPVDEVIGVGGYIRPGDLVDLVLFMPAGRENESMTSAQVVLTGARLLSVGDLSQFDLAARSDPSKQAATDNVTAPDVRTQDQQRRQSMRSVVLAVPEQDVTRVALAAGSGQLRLSLRPSGAEWAPVAQADASTDEILTARKGAKRNMITLSQLSPGGSKTAATQSAPVQGGGSGIIIQEGSKERRLVVQEAVQQP